MSEQTTWVWPIYKKCALFRNKCTLFRNKCALFRIPYPHPYDSEPNDFLLRVLLLLPVNLVLLGKVIPHPPSHLHVHDARLVKPAHNVFQLDKLVCVARKRRGRGKLRRYKIEKQNKTKRKQILVLIIIMGVKGQC